MGFHKFRQYCPGGESYHISLVGAGGNGAAMLMRLFKIHTALLALGRKGLVVKVYDPDTVSTSNLGRQPFYASDVGHNKAKVLIDRLGSVCTSVRSWQAVERKFTRQDSDCAMVITCVDNKAARREVAKLAHRHESHYWLDMGNGNRTGQVVLGQYGGAIKMRLPLVTELFPEILDESIPEDDEPSCSLAAALEKQDLFINEAVVAHAAALLWKALFDGWLSHSVIFVNLNNHAVQSIAVDDKEFWKRRGHTTGRRKNYCYYTEMPD